MNMGIPLLIHFRLGFWNKPSIQPLWFIVYPMETSVLGKMSRFGWCRKKKSGGHWWVFLWGPREPKHFRRVSPGFSPAFRRLPRPWSTLMAPWAASRVAWRGSAWRRQGWILSSIRLVPYPIQKAHFVVNLLVCCFFHELVQSFCLYWCFVLSCPIHFVVFFNVRWNAWHCCRLLQILKVEHMKQENSELFCQAYQVDLLKLQAFAMIWWKWYEIMIMMD